jgi:type I restriction enzyme S subunit
MNAAQVLDHFDRISDAPDAIPRLRRFILDLAVRGKLVEQDPNDEPVSELLKRIHQHKVQCESRRRGNNTKITFAAFEGPFRIPSSWMWMPFGDLMISRDGERIPVSQDERNRRAKIYEYYGASGVIDQIDSYLFDKPLLLIGEDGANLINRSTPIAFIARGKYWVNNHAHVLDGISENLLRYIQLYINAIDLKPYVTGTAQPKMNQAKMNSILIALPPEAEQDRIVAKVDELMALTDRLDAAQAGRERRRDKLAAASLHRLNNGADADEFRDHARFHLRHLPRLTTSPGHIQQLRQTILNLAVRGKLVPQDPNDEPASELLTRIQAEQVQLLKKGTIKRAHPTFSIDTTQIPSAAPHGWEWVKLGDLLLGDSQNGYSKKPDDAADGIPLLRISAGTLRKDGIVAEEEHKLIGGVSKAQKEQYELQPGDVLACRFNGNRNFVGRLSLYLGYLGIKLIYPDKLIRLRLLSQFVLPKLVRCFAESNMVRQEIEAYCATTVGNWGISASNLKEVKIPLPPLAEQHRIVAKVDELTALCDRLEAQLVTTQTENRRLLETVIHEALNSKIGLQG